jgi:hypothetical protein
MGRNHLRQAAHDRHRNRRPKDGQQRNWHPVLEHRVEVDPKGSRKEEKPQHDAQENAGKLHRVEPVSDLALYHLTPGAEVREEDDHGGGCQRHDHEAGCWAEGAGSDG